MFCQLTINALSSFVFQINDVKAQQQISKNGFWKGVARVIKLSIFQLYRAHFDIVIWKN